MKNEETKKLIRTTAVFAAGIMVCILFFFILFRFDILTGAFDKLVTILKAIIYGAVLAYILCPLCNWLERLLKRKLRPKTASALAILLSMVVAFLVIVAMLLLVIPQLISSTKDIVATLPGELESLFNRIEALAADYPDIQQTLTDYNDIMISKLDNWSTDFLKRLPNILGDILNQAVGIVIMFKDLMIGIIVSVYLLGTRRQFARQAKMIVRGVFSEKWADAIEGEVLYADRMFHGFLMGKIVDSAIIGVICFIGCAIFGFEPPILIAVIIGLTNIIPVFGPFIGAVPCGLLILLKSPLQCVFFLLFILVLQTFDGNILGPKVLGNATGVSSFWVLFSILLFGGIWGIVGMIVGVPLFAVIYDIIKKLVYFGLDKHDETAMIEEYNSEFHAPKEPKPKRSLFGGKRGA